MTIVVSRLFQGKGGGRRGRAEEAEEEGKRIYYFKGWVIDFLSCCLLFQPMEEIEDRL